MNAATATVPRVSWSQHIRELSDEWEPGMHVSIIGRTGWGKTVLKRELLSLWSQTPRILTLDIKEGGDIELQGGEPITAYPPTSQMQQRIARMWVDTDGAEGTHEHLRLLIPKGVENREQAKVIVKAALNDVYNNGDVVLDVDEVRAITDAQSPFLGLGAYMVQLWVYGRYENVTVITATQAPRWVPGEFYDQPTYLYIARLRDQRAVVRLREIGGNSAVIESVVRNLRKHEFLFIRDAEEMQIVRAPYRTGLADAT